MSAFGNVNGEGWTMTRLTSGIQDYSPLGDKAGAIREGINQLPAGRQQEQNRSSPLFLPQRLHGIDASCPPGGQKRGGRADAKHESEYNREGQWIAGLHAIKNSLQQSPGG